MKPTEALPHPPEWQTTSVGKAIELKRGISWSKDQEYPEQREGTVPVIRIGNVQDRLELDDLVHLSGVKPDDLINKRVASDWSIIVGSNGNRARVGNAVLIDKDIEFLFASFLVAAKPKDESELSPKYFFRWLRTEPVQAYLSASAEGTTGLNNLSHSFFKAMHIPLPPPDEQAAIARILDAVDAAIDRTREAVERARGLRKSLLADLLNRGIDKHGIIRSRLDTPDKFIRTSVGWVPSAWKISTLGEQFAIQTGFTINQDRHPRLNRRGYLRVANVQRDELNLEEIKELEAKGPEFIPRKLEVDDLLVVEGHADRLQIGRCARVTPEAAGLTFQNHLFRLRATNETKPYFGCLWLNSEYAQKYWNAKCATSSGLNTINQRMLKRMITPVPSPEEQEAISAIILTQRKHIDALKDKADQLLKLKQSLMHDLLTGKVRINNAQFDPGLEEAA